MYGSSQGRGSGWKARKGVRPGMRRCSAWWEGNWERITNYMQMHWWSIRIIMRRSVIMWPVKCFVTRRLRFMMRKIWNIQEKAGLHCSERLKYFECIQCLPRHWICIRVYWIITSVSMERNIMVMPIYIVIWEEYMKNREICREP